MSRISTIEQLYAKKKDIKLFDYDKLSAPPILSLLSPTDLGDFKTLATSVKYADNIDLKYKTIADIMRKRNFIRLGCGTNRIVYRFLEDPRFVIKIALDEVGMRDSPAEYINQNYFKPFCSKIFEVTPDGVVGLAERVNPVSSKEEFLSIAEDVFNLMVTKIIGKYVVDDLGNKSYANFGVRHLSYGCTFGPVVIDYPYVWKLDPRKTVCKKHIDTPMGKQICGGEIDYDVGLNILTCSRCGRTYTAQDLKDDRPEFKLFLFGQNIRGGKNMKVKLISNGKVLMESDRITETYITNEEFVRSKNVKCIREIEKDNAKNGGIQEVTQVVKNKSHKKSNNEVRKEIYSKMQKQFMETIQPDIEKYVKKVAVSDTVRADGFSNTHNEYYAQISSIENSVIQEVTVNNTEPAYLNNRESHVEEDLNNEISDNESLESEYTEEVEEVSEIEDIDENAQDDSMVDEVEDLDNDDGYEEEPEEIIPTEEENNALDKFRERVLSSEEDILNLGKANTGEVIAKEDEDITFEEAIEAAKEIGHFEPKPNTSSKKKKKKNRGRSNKFMKDFDDDGLLGEY